MIRLNAALPYLNQGLHLMKENGLVTELHQRFGYAEGERPQPGSVPTDQDQSLHVVLLVTVTRVTRPTSLSKEEDSQSNVTE